DRIELSNVTGFSGSTLSVAGFSQVPTPDAPWFYAQTGGSAPYRTFRIIGMRKTSDFNIELQAIEYNPAIYTDPTPSYGEVVEAPTVNAAVTGLTLTEKFQNSSDNTKTPTSSTVAVSWK